MYAIVTKVTTPPRISAPTVDPRRVISKNRSIAFFGSAGTAMVAGGGTADMGDLRGKRYLLARPRVPAGPAGANPGFST